MRKAQVAYDLLNTKLHVDDPDFGLNGGLFTDQFKSNDWKKNGSPSIPMQPNLYCQKSSIRIKFETECSHPTCIVYT